MYAHQKKGHPILMLQGWQWASDASFPLTYDESSDVWHPDQSYQQQFSALIYYNTLGGTQMMLHHLQPVVVAQNVQEHLSKLNSRALGSNIYHLQLCSLQYTNSNTLIPVALEVVFSADEAVE